MFTRELFSFEIIDKRTKKVYIFVCKGNGVFNV